MSWQDRLRGFIELTSPSGVTFRPKWAGDSVSIEKRVNRQQLYNIDKELADDLGVNSRNYPLTLYFDGPENDVEARDFENALCDPGYRGPWTVIHPVEGLLRLQPLSSARETQPVTSGNITVVSTEWMEPLEDQAGLSSEDAASKIAAAAEAVNAAAAADMAKADTSLLSSVKAIGNKVKQAMREVSKQIKAVNSRINQIQNTINDIANSVQMNVAELSGAVIQLVESPGLIIGNIQSRIQSFTRMGRQIMGGLSAAGEMTAARINSVLTGELFLNAVTAGMALSIIEELPQTRPEALSVLSQYRQFSRETRDALDALAKASAGNRFDKQYFPRRESAEAIATLDAAVTRYLISILFDLRVERTIVLDRPRAPLEIAITEYGASSGNADERYEYFLRTNNLHGNDILLLEAGREVKIYA
ncbi:MAG: hypothetical protein LBK08_10315 [Treponema sp.]|jgi:prophage DNA circulation protein|nr:hypothetical protein [Treponema sp.]